jgi:hypothetical protein
MRDLAPAGRARYALTYETRNHPRAPNLPRQRADPRWRTHYRPDARRTRLAAFASTSSRENGTVHHSSRSKRVRKSS